MFGLHETRTRLTVSEIRGIRSHINRWLTCAPVPIHQEVAVSGPVGQGCAHRSGFPYQGGSSVQDNDDRTDHRCLCKGVSGGPVKRGARSDIVTLCNWSKRFSRSRGPSRLLDAHYLPDLLALSIVRCITKHHPSVQSKSVPFWVFEPFLVADTRAERWGDRHHYR